MHLACIQGSLLCYSALALHNYHMKNCVDFVKKTPLDYALAGKHQSIIDFEKKLTTTLYGKKSTAAAGDSKASLKVSVDDFEYIMNLGRGAFGEVVLVK
jgi:hypothetical protein